MRRVPATSCARPTSGWRSEWPTAALRAENRERELAEELAREAARQWQDTFDASADAIWVLAEDSRIVRANRAAEPLFGRSQEEMVGRRCWEVAHGTSAPIAGCPRQRCEATRSRQTAEQRIGEGDFTITVDPMLDAAGRFCGAVHLVSDVTERKQAESAREASEARYRALFESSHDAIMTLEPPSWRFSACNPAAVRLFGLRDEAEILAATPWDLSPERQPDGRLSSEKAPEMIARALDQGSHFFRWTHLGLDGSVFPATVLLTRVELAGQVFMQAVVRDVGESERSEEALRASEARYRDLYDSAPNAYFAVDAATGLVRECNRAAGRLLGLEASALAGMQVLDLYADTPLGRDKATEVLRLLAAGREVRGVELQMKRADGSVVDVSLTVRPKLDESGAVVESRSVVTDITERKVLEEQLRSSQKMDAIGRLAGGVAHDFNNLLSVILSYTGFVMDEAPEGGPLEADLLEVKRAADRAVALTRQLLAFSRRQVFRLEPVDLSQIAAGVEKMLRRILGEDIDLVQQLAPDLALTLADAGQIEQVIMNLVINARDAMPLGGKLTIETRNLEIDEEYAARHVAVEPGSYVQLAVTDTGCGMDAATRERVFEPFFTTKETGKGTGLGLSTVYGIVNQSGGSIWVYSEPGRGTTFKVYLPRDVTGVEARTRTSSQAPARSTGSETVLVVEDEEPLRVVARRALSAAGYTVLTAADGEEALRLAAGHPGEIHLLLTDVVMPKLGGRALALELSKARPALVVVYMSGYTDDAIVHHGVLDADTHFLAKPFASAELMRKVREVLDGETTDGPAGTGR